MLTEITELLEEITQSLEGIDLTSCDRITGKKMIIDTLIDYSQENQLTYQKDVSVFCRRRSYRSRIAFVISIDGCNISFDISSCNRKRAITRLEIADELGYIPVLIRWNIPQHLEVPSATHLIDLVGGSKKRRII